MGSVYSGLIWSTIIFAVQLFTSYSQTGLLSYSQTGHLPSYLSLYDHALALHTADFNDKRDVDLIHLFDSNIILFEARILLVSSDFHVLLAKFNNYKIY